MVYLTHDLWSYHFKASLLIALPVSNHGSVWSVVIPPMIIRVKDDAHSVTRPNSEPSAAEDKIMTSRRIFQII